MSKVSLFWQDALAREPDGIGTPNSDVQLVRNGITQAYAAGIPVVVYNTNDPSVVLPYLTYVGADEFAGGVSNARRVFSEAAADGTEIVRGVCVNPAPFGPIMARCDGTQSVFDEEGVPLDRLGSMIWDPNQLADMLSDYFTNNPETNAVFLPLAVDLGANALEQYIREAEIEPRRIYATTWDTSSLIFQMIEEGYLLQTVDQQPYLQGFLTIMWLYLNSQYAMVPGGDVPTNTVVDQSNVDRVIELTAQGYR